MRYDAFISYRHSPLDMEIAKKLHTSLETYHVPGAVRKKTGKKKIRRVFRDQEELPIGSDLNDNISGALMDSEFLIVVCSPRTPESYWVCKEIESFIKMHDREHVLAVLIEGEPNESFPPQLLTDENGNPVEPLAADIRGENRKERNKKFKSEILRLAAPLLSCTYDDLRQRHKERIVRRTIATVSAATGVIAFAGTSFGVYNAIVAKKMETLANEKALLADEKSLLAQEKTALAEEKTILADEILAEYKDKQKNQSRFYAEKSQSLLKSGYREDAVLVAREGLPSEEDDRPYVPEAEYALSKALYAYDGFSDYDYDRVLKMDLLISEIKVNKDRTLVCASDGGYNLYVWDALTWDLKLNICNELDEDNAAVPIVDFFAYDDGVYVIRSSSVTKYDYDGNEIYREEPVNKIESAAISEETKRAVIYYRKPPEDGSEDLLLSILSGTYLGEIIDLSDGKSISTYELDYYPASNKKITFNSTGDKVICADYYNEYLDDPGKATSVEVYDINEGTLNSIYISDRYTGKIFLTYGGDICFTSYQYEFFDPLNESQISINMLDPSAQRVLWTKKVSLDKKSFQDGTTIIKGITKGQDEEEFSGILFAAGDELYVFDRLSGEIVNHINLNHFVSGVVVYMGLGKGLVSYNDGNIDYMNLLTGETDYSLHFDVSIGSMYPCNDYILLGQALGSEIYVMCGHSAPDLEQIATVPNLQYVKENSQKNDYFITMSYEEDTYYFYDKEGNLLFSYDDFDSILPKAYGFLDNRFVYVDMKSIKVIDPEGKSAEKYLWDDILEKNYTVISKARVTENGRFITANELSRYYVYDLESRSLVYQWEYDYLDADSKYVADAIADEEGKFVMVLYKDGTVERVDMLSGEKTCFDSVDVLARCGNTIMEKLALSHDGEKFAMLANDGTVKIFSTKDASFIDEIPLVARNKFFMEFSEDDRSFICQGDDLVLKIRDIENKSNLAEYELNSDVDYIIYDDEDKHAAVVNGIYMVLLETESFKVVASSMNKYAMSYMPSTDTFVFSYGKGFYRLKYKDYKTLLEEANRQFPDLKLTDDKKRKFNID